MNSSIQLPITKEIAKTLKAGDSINLTGTIYSARDAAHKRIKEAIDKKEPLPFKIEGSTIYYMGPSPARENNPIGSAGPTTAGRMDQYTPELLNMGLSAMIGKGKRDKQVVEAMKKNQAIYFAAVGGAGALLSKRILSAQIIAYEDLGAESILKLEVKDFPVIVVIDTYGNNLYESINH